MVPIDGSINNTHGLKQFIINTYLWTAVGISSSFGLGLLNYIVQHLLILDILSYAGVILIIIGITIAGFTNYTIRQEIIMSRCNQQFKVLYTVNPIERIASYICMIIGFGLVLMRIYYAYSSIILLSFMTTLCIFCGIIWLSMIINVDFEQYGNVLCNKVLDFISIYIIIYGHKMIYGPNMLYNIISIASSYYQCSVIVCCNGYNICKMVKSYYSDNPDHLGSAVSLYLCFIGLFFSIANIIDKKSEIFAT